MLPKIKTRLRASWIQKIYSHISFDLKTSFKKSSACQPSKRSGPPVSDGRFAAAPKNLVASISEDGNSRPYVCRALINDDTASDKKRCDTIFLCKIWL